jgi:hypothetical protein
MMLSPSFVFHVTVTIISAFVSYYSFLGIKSIVKYRKSQAIPLLWGVSISKRMEELQLISFASLLFAITFVFLAAYKLSLDVTYLYLSYIFGTISYSIVGYVVIQWSKEFSRL